MGLLLSQTMRMIAEQRDNVLGIISMIILLIDQWLNEQGNQVRRLAIDDWSRVHILKKQYYNCDIVVSKQASKRSRKTANQKRLDEQQWEEEKNRAFIHLMHHSFLMFIHVICWQMFCTNFMVAASLCQIASRWLNLHSKSISNLHTANFRAELAVV